VNAVGLWLQVMPSLSAILDSLRSGDRAFLEELQARFETVEPELHAFLPEEGRFKRLHTDFGELERRFPAADDRPPLFGLPIGVKDIFRVDGFETRAGSRLPPASLAHRIASHSNTPLLCVILARIIIPASRKMTFQSTAPNA